MVAEADTWGLCAVELNPFGPLQTAAATALRRWAWRNRVRELFGLPPLPPPTGTPVPPWPRVTIALAGAVQTLSPATGLVVTPLAYSSDGSWVTTSNEARYQEGRG